MDFYLSRIAYVSVVLFTLFLIASFLSIGLISKHGMDADAAKARNPDFKVRGMFLRNVGVVFGALALYYLLYFSRFDAYLYALIILACLPTIGAAAQAMKSIGEYSCETIADWRRIRTKAFFQAAVLIGFVYVLHYVKELI